MCLLDADSGVLGKLVTAKDKQIKLVMAEHKDVVSEILRAILGERKAYKRLLPWRTGLGYGIIQLR